MSIAKDERVAAKVKSFRGDYDNVPDNKKRLAVELILDLAFICVETEEMRAKLAKDGWSEKYQNGATQFGFKDSVIAINYDKMLKRKEAIVKILDGMLAEQPQSDASEDVAAYVYGAR